MDRRDGSSECILVGEGAADIAGIGILVGFIGQAIISLGLALWVFFLSKHGTLEISHDEGTAEREIDKKRLETVADILMIGNDIQMLMGLSYMINILTSIDDLDTYHMRLAFEILCFVGVSNASALVCWTFCTAKMEGHGGNKFKIRPGKVFEGRSGVTYTFALLFISLIGLLIWRLTEWDVDQEPGRCYHSNLIASSEAKQPAADIVYVLITSAWMLSVMGGALLLGPRRRHSVLLLSFLQFPVHLYMALALRTSQQGKLSGEEHDENSWDFGQTTAVVLLGVAVRELGTKGYEYISFERDVKKYGPKVASRIQSHLQRGEHAEETALEEMEVLRTREEGDREGDRDPPPGQDSDRQRLWQAKKQQLRGRNPGGSDAV